MVFCSCSFLFVVYLLCFQVLCFVSCEFLALPYFHAVWVFLCVVVLLGWGCPFVSMVLG